MDKNHTLPDLLTKCFVLFKLLIINFFLFSMLCYCIKLCSQYNKKKKNYTYMYMYNNECEMLILLKNIIKYPFIETKDGYKGGYGSCSPSLNP